MAVQDTTQATEVATGPEATRNQEATAREIERGWEGELLVKQMDAQLRAGESRLDALEADAHARAAKVEMEVIAGIRLHRDQARERLAVLKSHATETFVSAKRSTQQAIWEFEVAIEQMSDRFAAWDETRNAQLFARLHEAEARLSEWKATLQRGRIERQIRDHDLIAALEAQVELAKARAAEWGRGRHERKAAEAARDVARHFEAAYRAAARWYDGEDVP